MSNCTIFTEHLFQSITGVDGFAVDTGWLKSLIPSFATDTSGIWQPIVIKPNNAQLNPEHYCNILSRPYNIDDYKIPPCECSNVGARVARNSIDKYRLFGTYLGEEPEDGIFCSYCESLPRREGETPPDCIVELNYTPKKTNSNTNPATTTAYWNPQNEEPTVYDNLECCEGGCDTRALTDDLAPKIPYLYSNYHTKFVDFKYHKQFPSVANLGLGRANFLQYTGDYKNISISNDSVYLTLDWTLEPRLGEIPPPLDDSDTYHINLYSHKKSYKNYLNNNKTCGNFILLKPNSSEENSISEWQVNNYSALSGIILSSGVKNHTLNRSQTIPSLNDFSMPYGIKDNTHWNILLGPDSGKVGGLWKWNMSSGIIGWYRYYDKDREDDERPIQGVDLYISEGDVFFAKNDGPEPLAQYAPNVACGPKACPSGLKLNDYTVVDNTGTMTIVPSGSEFIYISHNLYQTTYDYMDKLISYHKQSSPPDNLLYKDLLEQSAILATGPQFDGITVDLFSSVSGENYNTVGVTEFVDIINKYQSRKNPNQSIDDLIREDQVLVDIDISDQKPRDSFGRDLETLKKITDKDMVSYNGMNFIKTKEDLVNTLVHKYGAFLFIPKDTEVSITLQRKVAPHIAIDINFDPVIRYRDTFNSTSADPRKLSCNSRLRGNTYVFGYDQKFQISDATLYSKILDDTLVYNSVCEGDPPESKPNVVSSIMSIYANEERIFAQHIGNYQTSITDIYSRFPSVSSTLDSTFQSLDIITDHLGNEGVYTLKKDAQLRLERSYRALAGHAGIDLVAFHEDGGFFYDSIMLNRYPGTGTVAFVKNFVPKKAPSFPIISFTTYDMGIKLYDISLQHLRSPQNLSCKTMPLDQSCKCWGLDVVENFLYRCDEDNTTLESPNLYTPYLSTASNPLKAYGGYSLSKINQLLGDFRIPGHPEPGQNMPLARAVLDLSTIFGCKETASITLPTLVNTVWDIILPDWDFDNNANLWVHVDDSNVTTERNAVQMIINDNIVIDPNTQVNLGAQLGRNLSVRLANILLDQALSKDDSHPIIYHPNLFTCSKNSINYYGEPELINKVKFVNITFGRVPFQTKTVFALPGIPTIGTLTEASFNPNSGLNTEDVGSSLRLDTEGLFNFDYGSRLFNKDNGGLSLDNTKRIFKGTISTTGALNLNKYLSLLDHSRKPRLYVLLNDVWYEYEEHKTFGYYNTQNNMQYYGWPTFFMEHHLSPSESMFGPFIPAVPKTPLEYIAFINDQSWIHMSALGRQGYPYSNMAFVRDPDNDKRILIEGSRAYFRFAADDDEQTYKLFNEDKIPYKEEFYPDILASRTDLSHPIYHIESAKIRSTELTEDQINNPYDISLAQPNTVISKQIGMNVLTFGSGEAINRPIVPDRHNNIYTILDLEQPVPYKRGYIVADKNKESSLNFTAFATTNTKNMVGMNQVITLDRFKNKESFSSKWSDLHYYSSPDILNNQVMQQTLNSVYAPSPYKNTLPQLISNNFYRSRFTFNENAHATGNYTAHWFWMNKSGTFLLDINLNDIYSEYYIHRPFSIDEKKLRYPYTRDKFNLSKNENGLIDINLSSTDTIYDHITIDDPETFKSSLWDGKGKGNTGLLCFSGVYRPSYIAPPLDLSSTGVNFFVHLDGNFRLKPTPIRLGSNEIYSDTFIINDTYDIYAGMKLNTTLDANNTADCTNIIVPNLTAPSIIDRYGKFNWSRFDRTTTYGPIYASYDILCDIDTGIKCSLGTQSLDPVGDISVQSKYYKYAYKYKSVFDISTENTVAFALSLDAGTYAGLFSTNNIPYVRRATFTEYSTLAPNLTLLGTSNCVEGVSYPPTERPFGPWDATYQSEIGSHLSDNLPIDTWANEVIFRSIYGSNQPVGYEDISKHGSSIRIDNDTILKYLVANPDESLQFLYDKIPLDYDRGATANNLSVNGTIQIYGIPKVGDIVRFFYNDEEFQIKITEDDKGIYAEVPQLGAKGLLLEKYEYSDYYYLREIDSETTYIDEDYNDTTETVVGTCSAAGTTSVGGSCECGGDTTHKQNIDPTCASPNPCYVGCISKENIWNPQGKTNGWPGCSNPNPCSAFPIKDINSGEHSSPVDQGFARYALTTALGGLCASEGVGYECGSWSVHTGAGSNCCSDDKDFGIDPLSYTIKSCHYTFTLKAMVENSIANIGALEFVDAEDNITCSPEYTIAYDTGPPAPALCDCGSPDSYPVGTFVNVELYYEKCGFYSFDIAYVNDCVFAAYGNCCKQYCEGDSWKPRDCGNCFWVFDTDITEGWQINSSSTPGIRYEIVKATSTRPSETYKPNCNMLVGTVIFNNFQLRINVGVAKSENGRVIYNGGNCGDRPVSRCPSLRISLPNNSYGVNEYTDTSCKGCKPTNNIIGISESPEFELVTETRYCILGVYSNFPGNTLRTTYGIGCAEYPYNLQYGAFERECNKTLPGVQLGGTAYSNWAYFVPHTMSALDSLEPPEKSDCTTEPVLKGMKQISASVSQSDPETAQLALEAWQSNMEEIFATKSWCNNSYEFDLDNLIEGVIPGTCNLQYGGGSIPVYGVRSSRSLVTTEDEAAWEYDSEVQSSSMSVTVAYISYQYVRPVTVQDKFIEKYKEDITFTECATFFGPAPKNNSCSPSPDNIKEVYKSTESKDSNCVSNPTCYDDTRGCAPTDICCQNNLKPG